MKALPLWQPWASLVAVGAKRIETRHWPAPAALIGRRIAIHATKTRAHLAIAHSNPFERRLQEADADGRLVLVDGELPLGAIIATAVLSRCTAMRVDAIERLEREQPDEHAFGLYEPGRYAWVLCDIAHLPEPVPFTGRQGIFDVPNRLLGHAAEPERQGALL